MSRRRKEYEQYLKSLEWKEHRDTALARTSGLCQYCGKIATQVHHTKYPKQFGDEHPASLIPVCDDCHQISHGIQEMKELDDDATVMTDLTITGRRMRYVLSGGRVYASAESWARALHLPNFLTTWFTTGLNRHSSLKSDLYGSPLEMKYKDKAVYRCPAVSEQLRALDRNWYSGKLKGKNEDEKQQINAFHEKYERLVAWGDNLQEKALSNLLDPTTSAKTPIAQENLVDAISEVVAPRLQSQDSMLNAHDIVISEIKDATPVLRDPEEFIPVTQAISEQGLDANVMPLHPRSNENLSGLVGQELKKKNAETGGTLATRLDGSAIGISVNTYRRKEIYSVLAVFTSQKQGSLF